MLLGGDDSIDALASDVTTTVARAASSPSSSTPERNSTTTAPAPRGAQTSSTTPTPTDAPLASVASLRDRHITAGGGVVTIDLLALNVTDSGLCIVSLRCSSRRRPCRDPGVAKSGNRLGRSRRAHPGVSYEFAPEWCSPTRWPEQR
jgi:hypothetical protein